MGLWIDGMQYKWNPYVNPLTHVWNDMTAPLDEREHDTLCTRAVPHN